MPLRTLQPHRRPPINGLASVVCIRIRIQLQSTTSLKSNAKITRDQKHSLKCQLLSSSVSPWASWCTWPHGVRNVRTCLVSKPHQAFDQLAKKASLIETFLERVCPGRTNAYITINRKPRKNISNPAICHYISELTRQLFDAGKARIQRVFLSVSENRYIRAHTTRYT